MAEETAAVEAPETNAALANETVGSKGYQVSTKELAEFGLNDADDDSDFVGEKVMADAKELKETPKSEDDGLADLIKSLDADESDIKEEKADNKDEPELELVRKGQTVKMKLSQAKNYAQKGLDYEIKSRELKGEREAFNAEKSEWASKIEGLNEEFSTLKKDKEQIDSLIEYIRETDADAYNLFETKAQEWKRNNHNPYMDRVLNELNSKIDKALGVKKASEDSDALTSLKADYFNQIAELKELHDSKFAKFGIKLDETAVKKEWIETGKPLKKIYKELYGDKLTSIAESKMALAIKQKASSTAPTMAKVKNAMKPTAELKSKLKSMSYSNIANEILAGNLR